MAFFERGGCGRQRERTVDSASSSAAVVALTLSASMPRFPSSAAMPRLLRSLGVKAISTSTSAKRPSSTRPQASARRFDGLGLEAPRARRRWRSCFWRLAHEAELPDLESACRIGEPHILVDSRRLP